MHLYSLLRFLQKYKFCSVDDLTFIASINLAFPCADIYAFENNTITQNLFNLAGQNAILPDHITELLLQSVDANDFIFRDFLDIFNNILMKQYYNAWRFSQFYIAYENFYAKQDYTLCLLKGLSGFSSDTHPIPSDDLSIYYSGILCHRYKSKQGLLIILRTYFAVPITIEEHYGHWLTINHLELSVLSHTHCYNKLGKNTFLGCRVWYNQNRFKISIGTINYDELLEFLPNRNKINLLKDIIKLYCGIEYFFEIQFKVEPVTIPAITLTHTVSHACYLGWNTWIKKVSVHDKKTVNYQVLAEQPAS